jgi:pimeloyl-ACP methyl ester carboxylesterase
MLQERRFDTGEVSLNYAEGPASGPALVLLHGIPGRWQEFLPLVPNLAARWHIYALDLRGQGGSGRVTGCYLPGHYTADITAFLQRHVAEPAVLFGASAGGLLAVAAAAQTPGSVRALIIGDSPTDLEALEEWMCSDAFAARFTALQDLAASGLGVADLARALGDLPAPAPGQEEPVAQRELAGMDAAYLRAWAKMMSQMDPGVLDYHAGGLGREYLAGIDLDGMLSRISCPVLLLRANPDLGALMSPSAADHAVSLLADGLQVELENAGHNLGLDSWDVGPLLRAVTGFLESLR